MKAIVLNLSLPQGIELLDLPIPELKPGEVLVKVKASALNHRDEWCRIGKYANLKNGIVLGSDGAGTVEKVNSESDSKWIGKEVIIHPGINWGTDQKAQSRSFEILGMPRNGTLAEYVAVPADRLVEKPQHLSWEQAAALPLAGLTAYRALFYQGQLVAGENVLVTGFGGGVAQFAAQFAMAAGGILAVSSSKNWKLEMAKEMGAPNVLDYTQSNWTSDAIDTIGGFDLIIDGAAGDTLNQLTQVCKPGARIVIYGATRGVPESLEIRRVFWNQLKIIGSTMGSDSDFEEMLRFVSEKDIKPVVDQIFSLVDAEVAFDRMRAGEQLGKIVLRPD
jgi:zinc-binding alcohol dehydrogenase/oxidoreductase